MPFFSQSAYTNIDIQTDRQRQTDKQTDRQRE